MRKQITLTLMLLFAGFTLFAQKQEVKELNGTKNVIKQEVPDKAVRGKKANKQQVVGQANPHQIIKAEDLRTQGRPIPMEEDFEEGEIPTGWLMQGNASDWVVSEDNSSSYWTIPEHTYYASINDDAPGSGADNSNTYLATNPLNFSSSDITLTFESYAKNDYNSSATFAIVASTDNMATMDTIAMVSESEVWVSKEVDLNGYQDSSEVRIGFYYDDGGAWGYGWAIDDIVITGVVPPANDAGISRIASPDASKSYVLEGEYDVQFENMNYGSDTLLSDSIAWGYIEEDIVSDEVDTTYGEPFQWTGSLPTGESTMVSPGTYSFNAGMSYGIKAYTYKPNGVEDMVHANDTATTEMYVYKAGQIIEDFEGSDFPPKDWSADASGWAAETGDFAIDGNSAGVWQDVEIPRKNLYTPKLKVDGSVNHLKFDLAGVNNEVGYGSSKLTIKYAQSMDGEWSELVTFDMADELDAPQEKVIDLSSLEEGEYYFAFSTVSDFDYTDPWSGTRYYSAVVVDNLAGPVVADIKDNDLAVTNLKYMPHEFLKAGEDSVSIEAVVKNVGLLKQEEIPVSLTINDEEVASKTIAEIGNNETRTLEFKYLPENAGEVIEASVFTPVDEDTLNNKKNVKFLAVDHTMKSVGFEGITDWIAEGWTYFTGEAPFVYEGDNAVYSDGDGSGGPWEDYKLINDHKITTESDFNKFYFYARRQHIDPSLDYESTIKLMYANELNDNTEWTQVGETVELTDEYALYCIDVSELPDGNYYFAFSASSNYIDSEGNIGSVLMDHLITPPYPGPKVTDVSPMPEATGVPHDADIAAMFDQEVYESDFSKISVTNEAGEEVALDSIKLDSVSPVVHIYPDTLAQKGETYTVSIPYNTVTNGVMPNDSMQWSFTTVLPAPEATVYYPENEAEGLPLDADLYLKFNQELVRGSGAVTISSAAEGGVPVTDAYVGSDMKTLVIEHGEFAYEDTLTITVDSAAVMNKDDVANMETSWTFYTMTEGQPVVEEFMPENNDGFAALDAEVAAKFNEGLVANDLSSITITGENSGEVSGVSASISDSTLVIEHDEFPANDEMYTVTIPAGAVKSLSTGTENSRITWNFSTIMAEPAVTAMDPMDNATSVPMDYSLLSVSFDQTLYTTDVDLDTMVTVVGAAEDTIPLQGAWVSDNVVYIELDENFGYNNSTYTVTLMENAVHNLDSVYKTEMSWQFNTIMAAPEIVATAPEAGSEDIALDSTISVEFNQSLTVNDLSVIKVVSQQMGEVPGVEASYIDSIKTVRITHDGFYTANNDVYTVIIPANAVKNADGVPNGAKQFSFSTISTYSITFEVKGEDGPLEGARTVLGQDTMMTDSVGEVVYDGIVENTTLDYCINAEGYRRVTGSVIADAHKILAQTLTRVYSVTLTVNDEEGNPVEAAVTFAGVEDSTDAEGVITFDDLEAGSYSYYVSSEDYNPEIGTLDVSEDLSETVTLSLTVGINYLSNSDIDVYPNPTGGRLHINNLGSYENAQLEVISTAGKVVHKQQLNNLDNTIDLQNHAKGVYILKLRLDDKVVNGKLILK